MSEQPDSIGIGILEKWLAITPDCQVLSTIVFALGFVVVHLYRKNQRLQEQRVADAQKSAEAMQKQAVVLERLTGLIQSRER